MFRPIRTLILLAVVFLAGIFFERYQQLDRCTAAGGTLADGLCQGEPQ
ncbi:hypothetical protein HAT86_05200 [Roseovarius gahaiensis]|uniref:Uncharacterized protein n=1 Tax=Roseovarius gahaiensis TaxID=2716691 RepID=A0A967EE52_9RHOB|nr:hypothetical protein [Roseovarius gahaiensis]NHQ73863.1 hypothetical protein [Roseovarius gahaiensis]